MVLVRPCGFLWVLVGPHAFLLVLMSPYWSLSVHMRTVTIRRGRLGAGLLGAADYAPGLLGAWTVRRRDFYAPEIKNFFFYSKFFFKKKNFFSKKSFFSRFFFTKTNF